MKPTERSVRTKPIEKPAATVPAGVRSLRERLIESGAGKGSKLKVTLPKRKA